MKSYCLFLFVVLLYSICEANTVDEGDIFLGEEFDAGYMKISETKKLFYWLFPARTQNPEAPLILFLEGGPGCSTAYQIFMGMGPFRINDDLTLTQNPYSWTDIADVLFIDQPIGTGFSYADNTDSLVSTSQEAAEYLLQFFIHFLEKYPSYKTRSFYITGESYGGRFATITANLFRIKAQEAGLPKFSAILLGNPLLDFGTQMKHHPNFTMKHKLVNTFKYELSKLGIFLTSVFVSVNLKGPALLIYRMSEKVLTSHTEFNQEFIGEPPMDYSKINKFMDLATTRAKLPSEIGSSPFVLMNEEVGNKMADELFDDVKPVLADLLESKVHVVIFEGEMDWLLDHEGMYDVVSHIPWQGKDAFMEAQSNQWYVHGQVLALYYKYEELIYVSVRDAGHTVTAAQPLFALDMLDRVIYSI
jgi:carboxypeptidase C (cathepsin A)